MTTQFNSRFFGLIASILIVSNSFAQLSAVENLQPALNNSPSVKTYENVVDKFQKIFVSAGNVRWEKIQKNFLAKFSVGDLEKRALLNPKGQLIYEISYGKEKHLPVEIRKAVKRMYVEFVISSAVKVEEDNRTVWVIYLEDDESFASIRVENNEMEETQKYAKIKP